MAPCMNQSYDAWESGWVDSDQKVNNETDRLALLDFKAKISKDPLGVMSSWNDSIHFCQWKGVSCGRRHRRVTVLNLQSQKLAGFISPNVGNLSFLWKLNLENNSFYNKIPPEIGRLNRLEVLLLSNNSISGTIPSNLSSCANLTLFNAAGNNLVGEIPTKLGTLSKLRIFAIHKNSLTGIIPPSFGNLSSLEGKIPASLASCVKLEFLAMRRNFFQGVVPSSWESLRGLEHLDFSNNKFSGMIPKFLETFDFLKLLNLSYNHFEGEVPTNGVFKNASATLIKGNVYKGILDQYKHTVAIKVLNLGCHGASKSFKAKCEALRNIRHRNLVKVLTVCSGVDYQGNDFKALAYEFMGNGNLDEWLHPTPRKINEALEKQRKLSLLQRLNIAIDVASALDYLHHHCETPIVHCDLKPSNVLLDDEMIGHVSDFGLARILHDIIHDSSTNQSSSIGVKGTVGYTPPEYGMGNKVSIYGDVYSYGILLLEMFTGKKPIDNSFHDSLNLHDFVKANLPERIFDIIDPILLPKRQGGIRMNDTCNENRNGSLKIQECLILILGIGIACSTEYPRERMNTSAVVVELNSIRQNLLRTWMRQVHKTND
uniref:non-specific serine/threonine protein kinase n=1 Tax=Quercus lobata TaxID=97700 RepID=A0A7N2R2N9_QUELO